MKYFKDNQNQVFAYDDDAADYFFADKIEINKAEADKLSRKEEPKEDEVVRKQIEGVKFNGVMCSATNDDIVLLKSLESYILDGYELTFPFKNGNSLVLNLENYMAFKAVYDPFVISFFIEKAKGKKLT